MDAQTVENRGKICDDCDLKHGFLPVCTECGCVIPAKIRLENQMCHGVRWRETMDAMSEYSELHLVEIGPSNVLSGLGKRHLKDVKISQVSSSDQINY